MDTTEMKNVYAKLWHVQQQLRVPKDRRNSFGNYVFRNAADILEKAKPFLEQTKTIITLSDTIKQVGVESRYTCTDPKSPYSGKELACTPRYYIESTATFIDTELGGSVQVMGQAREDESKKGMDAAQLTGACSSYARKYALCGLLAIDDSRLDPDEPQEEAKDAPRNATTNTPGADITPTRKTQQRPSSLGSAMREKAKEAWDIYKELKSVKSMDENSRKQFFKTTLKTKVGKDDPAKLTAEDWDEVIGELSMMRCV